jgi:UDP-3-O-[3-hydroxymyristoyl] glucosamine N-acyltransferase
MYSLAELARTIGAVLQGDPGCRIERVAPIDKAGPGAISFLASKKYLESLKATKASAVILPPDTLLSCPVNALVTDNPYLGYAKIAALLNPAELEPGIHLSAIISESSRIHSRVHIEANVVIQDNVVIAEGTRIGAGSVIGREVQIGQDCDIRARVTLCDRCVIGNKVTVQPGAVIGGDGFGFASDKGAWVKIPQLGRVIVGDGVEIGANTTIDRGALEDTIIEEGVILDNQIQIGHNTRIGAHTAIVACTGISGSTRIGKHCTIAGAVGIAGHIEIVDNVHITGMSMVTKSVMEPGLYSSGIPLQPNREWHRNAIRFRHLEEMAQKLKKLEKQLADLVANLAT